MNYPCAVPKVGHGVRNYFPKCNLKIPLSETIRPKAFLFGIQLNLYVIYQFKKKRLPLNRLAQLNRTIIKMSPVSCISRSQGQNIGLPIAIKKSQGLERSYLLHNMM